MLKVSSAVSYALVPRCHSDNGVRRQLSDMFVETQCRIQRHSEQLDCVLELDVNTSDVYSL